MKVFWSVIYNLILYPLLFTGACIASFFHLKLRQSIKGKFNSISQLKLYFKNIDSSHIIYWFHSASLGEYHQVLPVLKGLKEVEDPKGKELDTNFHEAVTNIPASNKKEKGKIVDVIEKGYILGERVIRFSKVVVAN